MALPYREVVQGLDEGVLVRDMVHCGPLLAPGPRFRDPGLANGLAANESLV